MMKPWLWLILFGGIIGCTGTVTPPQNQAAQTLEQQTANECASGQCPCTSPSGPVANGATITVYNVNQVACGQTCDTQSTTITCTNGKFDQDISKLSFSCAVAACSACTIGNSVINDGGSLLAYNISTADCGDSCTAHQLTRVCTNGQLSGDSSYNQTNCQPAACDCQLPDNTGFLTLGGSMPFYTAKTASCGQTCAGISQTRTCTSQGTGSSRTFSWSGTSNYIYSTCNNPDPAQCQCPLPGNLGSLASGQSFTLSSTPTATCTKCAQLPGQTVLCSNGSLVDATTHLPANPTASGYVYQCVQGTCPVCNLAGYGTISQGSPVTLFSSATVNCGVDPATLTYNFSCIGSTLYNNGQVYTPTGITKWYTTMAPSCTGCRAPWGETFATGSVVTMNKLNTGSTLGACGQSCSSFQATCQANGTFTGDGSFTLQSCTTTCAQTGGGAPPRTCLLPWQNSFVTPGAQIPMWSKKTVHCPDSCQNYFKVGTCQISTGTFDAGFAYIYQVCNDLCP